MKRKENDPEFKLMKILRSRIGNAISKIKNAKNVFIQWNLQDVPLIS